MSIHLKSAQKLFFTSATLIALICAHAANAATAAVSAGAANTAPSVNGGIPTTSGSVPNTTNGAPPYTTNAAPPNAINGTVPNAINGTPPNTINGAAPNTANTNNNQGAAHTGATVDWNAENQYWRNHFPDRPYYNNSNANYTMYEPAYQYGVTSFSQFGGQSYSSIDQAKLRAGWEQSHGNSSLTWDQAQPAIRDAYDRLYDNGKTQ